MLNGIKRTMRTMIEKYKPPGVAIADPISRIGCKNATLAINDKGRADSMNKELT